MIVTSSDCRPDVRLYPFLPYDVCYKIRASENFVAKHFQIMGFIVVDGYPQ